MKKTGMLMTKLLMLLTIIITGSMIAPGKPAYAAGAPVKIVSVEYYEEQIVVQNNGNSKICFATESDVARNNWEVVDADSGSYTTIDMSWLSATTENTVFVKGYNDSTNTSSRVVLKARPTKLGISISYANLDSLSSNASIAPLVNIMTTEGNGVYPITFNDLEWRKGDTGLWKNTKELTASLLEKYLIKGTDLYFRIRAKDDVINTTPAVDFDTRRADGKGGLISYLKENPAATIGSVYPDGQGGRRFSNEVKVKISKKPTATGYGIDGSRFTADIRYGKEYRVTVAGSSAPSGWVQVTDRTMKNTPLSSIVKSAIANSSSDGTIDSKKFPAMKIEVRQYATSKAASSKITEVSLNEQRTITEAIKPGPANAPDDNIYVSYNGNKNIILEIPSASQTKPYEYTVVRENETLNMEKASWTAVTKGAGVKILSTKAVNKGTLYVRMKEIKAKKATSTSNEISYELASTYVSATINYPSIPDITKETIVFTKGYSTAKSFNITLGAIPFETEIDTIKLGTKSIEFTQAPVPGSPNIVMITLKAESLNALSNCYAKPLTITYKKGTVDKTSLKLTIENPTPAAALTVTHMKGSTSGTAFTIVTAKGIGNSWVYVKTNAAVSGVNMQDTVKSKTSIDVAAQTIIQNAAMDNVSISAGEYLTIFEVNASGYIVKYKSIQMSGDYIK